MIVSQTQKLHLYDEGYTIFQNIIPPKVANNALRHINANLSDTDIRSEGKHYEFMKTINKDPQILDLFYKTTVKRIVDFLIGKGQYDKVDVGQIALRFPVEKKSKERLPWHLDGLYNSKSGAQKNPWNFSLLVGVFLSDLSKPGCGNLTVYPKGHQILAKYFKKHGIDTALKSDIGNLVKKKKEITCNARDVVICHPQLPHLGYPINTSPNIRYLVFFSCKS